MRLLIFKYPPDVLTETAALWQRETVLEGLRQFREHLGGALCVTLPQGLGAKTEVHEMDEARIERAVALLRERYA